MPFEGFALSHSLRGGGIRISARHEYGQRHPPDMPPIDIVLVGRVQDITLVRREFHIFNVEISGRKQQRLTPSAENGIKMIAAILFGIEDDLSGSKLERLRRKKR